MADGPISHHLGEILLNIDDGHMLEAEKWIQKAIEADQRNGMRFHLGMDLTLYAEFLKRKGNLSEAREHLGKALETFKEIGADGWVEKYEKKLAHIS